MKHQPAGTESLVYAYGCAPPVAGLAEAQAENARMRVLWDTLVNIEQLYEREQETRARVDVRDIDAALIRIAAIGGDLAGAQTRDVKHALIAQRRRERNTVRQHLASWRKAHRDEMQIIERRRRECVIAARQATDAWWPNYNNVIQRYETARVEMWKTGKRLRPSGTKRMDGCLNVQIQRTPSGLGAASDELRDGTVAALAITRAPAAAYDPHTFRGERHRLCKVMMEMRIDRTGNLLRLPVFFHRLPPADVRVKAAQLVWRSTSNSTRYQLCLTLSRARVERVHDSLHSADVVIALESRGLEILVARAIGSEGAEHTLVLDVHWIAMMDRVDRLASVIDDADAPAHQRIRARMERPGLWHRLLLRRREQYRLFARMLAWRYGGVQVHSPELVALAHEDHDAAKNALRHRACAHQLIAEIKHQCNKSGSAFIEILAVRSTSASLARRMRRRKINTLAGAAPQNTEALAQDSANA